MSDKKHIDRLFQEKLKDFEATPNEAVWGNINSQLKKSKGDRKVIPIWWKFAGVAAGLILLLTVGNLIFNGSNNTTNVVDTENNDSKNEQTDTNTNVVVDSDERNLEDNLNEASNETLAKDKNHNKPNISNKNEKVADSDKLNTNSNQTKSKSENKKINAKKSSNTNNYLVNSQTNQAPKTNKNLNEQPSLAINKTNGNISLNQETKKEAPAENKVNESNVIEKNITRDIIGDIKEKELIVNNEKEKTPLIDGVMIGNKDIKEEQLVIDEEKDKIPLTEDLIVSNENSNEEEKDKINRWQINPNIAPVYFNSFGDGSPIHEQLINNEKSGEINMSYGLNVSYAVNNKLSVKAGVNKVNLGYNTNDIIIYENVDGNIGNTDLFRNIKLNNNLPQLSFLSGSNFSFAQSPSIVPNESLAFLSQQMTYFEIPLEIKYNLSKRKLGFSLVGGFSTFILSDNKVSYELRGINTELGEAANLNDVSYSANIGFGLNYNIVKNINLNIDPMFKYQINTFNNTSGNFRPYVVGIYTGLNYKF